MKKLILPLLIASHLHSACYVYPERHQWIRFTKEELQAHSTFRTHSHPFFGLLHLWNESVILAPFYFLIHAQSYFVQQRGCRKIAALSGCFASFLPGMQSLMLGMAIRLLEHHNRPHISYLCRESDKHIALDENEPFHVCTYNVALTPSSVNIKMNLRPPVERAHALAEAILNDPTPPHLLMIQEGWHEEALKILVTHLSSLYPHILYHVAPQAVGMSSGIALFSQHAFDEVKFTRLEKMPLFHNLPSRGILCVSFQTKKGPLLVYGGIHTQSMLDEASVRARKAQFAQLHACVEADRKSDVHQIVMGDMNTTLTDHLGQDNRVTLEGQAWSLLHDLFDDPFLADHDASTGVRTSGEPWFLKQDNVRLGMELPEPHGSWYEGQNITRARYDYILVPKGGALQGHVEIRNDLLPKGCKMPPSDHLPVHGLFWAYSE